MINKKITFLFLGLLMFACTTDKHLRSTHDFPEKNWHRFSNTVLQFQINNPGIYYDMYLELEFDKSQTPDDFKITVAMNTPSGEMRNRDLTTKFNSALIEGENGIMKIPLRRDFAFSEKGLCTFEVENRSSKMNTPGMIHLSIILEKSQ